MSLWNGMWHGLLNDIILGNVIYAECLKEIIIKLVEKSVIFWRQSISKSSRFFNVAGSTTMTIKQATKNSLISHCRYKKIAFFSQPQGFYLSLSLGLHGSMTSRKSAIEEKKFWNWKVTLPSALIFAAKNVYTNNFTTGFFFYLYLYLKPLETQVAWSRMLSFLFFGQTLRNYPSRNSTLFSSRRSTLLNQLMQRSF